MKSAVRRGDCSMWPGPTGRHGKVLLTDCCRAPGLRSIKHLVIILLQIYCWMWMWKNFEALLIFGEWWNLLADCFCTTLHIVSQEIPLRFSDVFPKWLGIFNQFLHTFYMLLSTLDYTILLHYLQLWRSHAILSNPAPPSVRFSWWWTFWTYDVMWSHSI